MDDYNNDKYYYNPEDNSWSYTSGPDQDRSYYGSSDYDRHEDNYEDLKTSSFYNESYKKPSKGRLKGLFLPMLVVALISSILTGAVVGAYFTYGISGTGGNNGGKLSGVTPETTPVKQIEIIDNTTSAETVVAEKVSPSIVGISVSFRTSDLFFGTQQNQGSGSGIIYRSDGYIITNNHVIEDAMLGASGNKIAPGSKIQVILPNQIDNPYDATVVGRDSKTDIAILKINASELPAAEFGDSDKVKVGEKAIAIGNPAGLEFMGSVTSGIISGLNRELELSDGKKMKLIQTDAAINPGNSGGALLNSKGQVIGINTSKIGGSYYEGLGFAIPSNKAVEIAESLIQSGYVTGRPKLGISVDTRFNEEIAKANKVPLGILVYDVEPLSGAYNAGIRSGDIITKFNGVAIKNFDELETEKNKYKAGDTVEIELYRMPNNGSPDKGQYLTVKVVLGEDKG
ncbi:MAG: PDZ domain-containing protein [Clostridiaceae bacterium]|nr:PDZ domain-containing protein [Clostridiaceae bacterium]